MPKKLTPHAARVPDRIQLVRFTEPRKWIISYTDDGEPIYDDCLRCERPNAEMAGAVVEPHGQVVMRLNDDGLRCHNMLYCTDCYPAIEERSKREGATKVNHE